MADYHFPMLTLRQAAEEGVQLFGFNRKSIHFRVSEACLCATSIEDALRSILTKTDCDRIDAENAAYWLRASMNGNIPYAIDKYIDAPEREIINPFPWIGVQVSRNQLSTPSKQ